MNPRIVFNTWSGAFFNPGGGEVQLNCTRQALQDLDLQVELYNQWAPQRDLDIFHQFSIQHGVEYPMIEYRNLGKKIALSTILWVEFPKGSEAYKYLHRILNLADILFTNSDLESTKLSRAFDVDLQKFHKTVNGISDAYLTTQTAKDFRQCYRIEGDFILTVANIDRRKNTHSLIKACEMLNKQLISIGHIRDPEYFREFQSSSKNFKHLGPITDTELLKSAYQEASLFALPSLCETPGIAALEAASQGSKILITTEGAAPEYFGEFADYVSPWDLTSIISGLETALSRPRNKLAIIENVQSNYTWSQTARQVQSGYSKIF